MRSVTLGDETDKVCNVFVRGRETVWRLGVGAGMDERRGGEKFNKSTCSDPQLCR